MKRKDPKSIFEMLTPKALTFYLEKGMTVRQAMEKFDAHKFSVVPILSEEGDYITTVSEGDLLRFIKNDCSFDMARANSTGIMKIEHYRPYSAVSATVSFDELFFLMLSQNFVPVLDDRGKFIGIIKRSEVFKYLRKKASTK